MRFLLFVLGILAATVGTPAEAQTYSWCAIYSGVGGGMNCGFRTFEQCMATVRGIGGFCNQNPAYQPPGFEAYPAKRRYRY